MQWKESREDTLRPASRSSVTTKLQTKIIPVHLLDGLRLTEGFKEKVRLSQLQNWVNNVECYSLNRR
jgi:hypothetical protein